MANAVTIASIYFAAVRSERPLLNPERVFELPAVPRDAAPATISFEDAWQIEPTPITHTPAKKMISSRALAEDLVDKWTGYAPLMSQDCHPGIWVCAGLTPTKEEIAEAARVQTAYANELITAARRAAGENRHKEITPLMRSAALWLRLEGEAWQHIVKPEEQQVCRFCRKTIPTSVIKCPECKEILDVGRYAAHMAEVDSALKGVGVGR